MSKKPRLEVFLALAKIRMAQMASEEVADLIEEYDTDSSDPLQGLAEALAQQYSGVTNGFLTEVYELVFDEKHEIEGDVDDLHTCPSCQYKTLDEIYDSNLGTGYDICSYCGWEDDGTSDINAQRSVNKGSIADYRKKLTENPNYYYREKYRK